MKKTQKITALGKEITISFIEEKEFLSLNDMVKNEDGDRLIKKWLSNKKTLEYLAAWERMHNPNFKWAEFGPIEKEAGDHNFAMSADQWMKRTGAIGTVSRKGRYGGTYAHIDIAFHFAMWVSPEFHLAVIKDYQRLKNQELERGPWNAKRLLAKVNYRMHTDAIKEYLVPFSPQPDHFIYANEADLLNLCIFGKTKAQWDKENPEKAAKGENQRDHADFCQIAVLANLEFFNSMLIARELPKPQREVELYREAQRQLKSLYNAEMQKRSFLN